MKNNTNNLITLTMSTTKHQDAEKVAGLVKTESFKPETGKRQPKASDYYFLSGAVETTEVPMDQTLAPQLDEVSDEAGSHWEYFPEAEFIYNGSWFAPELKFNGRLYNYYEIEDAVYETFKDETGSSIELDKAAFKAFCLANADLIRDLFEISPSKVVEAALPKIKKSKVGQKAKEIKASAAAKEKVTSTQEALGDAVSNPSDDFVSSKGITVSKADFKSFVEVQESGVTNMFDRRMVCNLAGISNDVYMAIISGTNYTEMLEKFGIER